MEYPNVDLNKVERAFSVFVNEYRCGHIKPSYFLINAAYTGLYYMISYDFSFAAVNNGKLSFAKVDMNEASQFLGTIFDWKDTIKETFSPDTDVFVTDVPIDFIKNEIEEHIRDEAMKDVEAIINSATDTCIYHTANDFPTLKKELDKYIENIKKAVENPQW